MGTLVNIFNDKNSQKNKYSISKKDIGIDNISKVTVHWGDATVRDQDDKIIISTNMQENDAVVIEISELP